MVMRILMRLLHSAGTEFANTIEDIVAEKTNTVVPANTEATLSTPSALPDKDWWTKRTVGF